MHAVLCFFMNPRTIRLNIALIPPQRVEREAKKVSSSFIKEGGLFVLDDTHHPHVTLYMSDFPREALPRILSALTGAFQWRVNDPIALEALSCVQKKDGYVEVQFRNSDYLKKLQKEIVSLLNPLRGDVPAHQEAVALFSKTGQRNVRRYGYPAIGRDFCPHLSLTRFKERRPHAPLKIIIQNFSFVAGAVGIYLTGEHNTCKKLLGSFRLSHRPREKGVPVKVVPQEKFC